MDKQNFRDMVNNLTLELITVPLACIKLQESIITSVEDKDTARRLYHSVVDIAAATGKFQSDADKAAFVDSFKAPFEDVWNMYQKSKDEVEFRVHVIRL